MDEEWPAVVQFDATLDVGGTFYVLDGWRQKHEELLQALQERFHAVFRNNGNSFVSCFQFQQAPQGNRLSLRIKVYNKVNALLFSESV